MRGGPCGKMPGGQACVEFAMLLLVIVLLLMGVFDLACAIRANNTIANMSREGANLASRSSAGLRDNPQAIMDTLAATAQSLDMRGEGMMYITVVQGGTITLQEGWKNGALAASSKVGTPSESDPHPKARNLESLNLTSGQTAYVVEVFYDYRSLFSNGVMTLANRFYSRTVF